MEFYLLSQRNLKFHSYHRLLVYYLSLGCLERFTPNICVCPAFCLTKTAFC